MLLSWKVNAVLKKFHQKNSCSGQKLPIVTQYQKLAFTAFPDWPKQYFIVVPNDAFVISLLFDIPHPYPVMLIPFLCFTWRWALNPTQLQNTWKASGTPFLSEVTKEYLLSWNLDQENGQMIAKYVIQIKISIEIPHKLKSFDFLDIESIESTLRDSGLSFGDKRLLASHIKIYKFTKNGNYPWPCISYKIFNQNPSWITSTPFFWL